MRHDLTHIAALVVLLAVASPLAGAEPPGQPPTGPVLHQPRHVEMPGAKAAAKAPPAPKPLWDRLLKSIVDVGIDLLSGNEAELLSGNEAELLSNNRAELLSGNSPTLLSGNKPEVLSRNQTSILSGNRISLLPAIKVEIHITNSGNHSAGAAPKP